MDEATQEALAVLLAIAGDSEVKKDLRIEAAKIVVNRPRHFVEESVQER